ncbi:hypothetical protein QQ045_020275 [Rhodiola kirilowii]
MSCPLSSLSVPKPPTPHSLSRLKWSSLVQITSQPKQPLRPFFSKICTSLQLQTHVCTQKQPLEQLGFCTTRLALQVGALIVTSEQPALAITGVNNQEDFTWVLIQLGISALIYFLMVPPFIMNWLRLRWYKRNLIEMYLQFMCVFIFFPGMMLWAPFVNVRKLPRDPNMKYPWSVPDDPSKIKNDYLRYPWAKDEDYEVF